jgi:hypothetical protein
MRQRVGVSVAGVSVVGVAVVMAYAGLMALQALVLDPLAAVPGRSLAAILGALEGQGFDVAADVWSVLVTAAVGVLLAVGVAVWGTVDRLDPVISAVLFLALLVFGAPVTFGTGFALGMDVADGFGTDGASHTIWAGVLYGTSLAALVAIPLTLVVTWLRRNGRRGRAVVV